MRNEVELLSKHLKRVRLRLMENTCDRLGDNILTCYNFGHVAAPQLVKTFNCLWCCKKKQEAMLINY